MLKSKKGNFIRKKIIGICLAAFLVLSGFGFMPNKAKAGAWGESIESVLMHEAWTVAREAFIEAMISGLKMEANNLIKNKITSLLGGAGNDGLVIGDYETFIYNNSQAKADAYMYDFFRDLESGASVETKEMYKNIENNLLTRSNNKNFSTIDEYVEGGAGSVFDQSKGGGIQALMAMGESNFNDPYGTYLQSSAMLEKRKEIEQNKAEVEAISGQGFKSRRDGNLIDLPGSVLADITSKSKSNYFDLINNATSIAELSGTLAAGVLTQAIKEGVTDGGSGGQFGSQSGQAIGEMGGVGEIQGDIYNGIEFSGF